MAPAFLLFTFVLFIPICQSVYYSFCEYNALTKPEFIGFENYKYVLSDTEFLRTLKNTVLYVSGTMNGKCIIFWHF